MSLGNLILSPVYRGSSFVTAEGFTYLLCDGSSHSRGSYNLASAFPADAYTSVPSSSVFYLPDLGGDGYFLRGTAFQSTACDPSFASRTVLSGLAPTTSGIGSFQAGNFATHTHPSGVQQSYNRSTGGGDGNCCYPNEGSKASNGPSMVSGPTAVGSAAASEFDLAHMKVYPYILAKY
jgi:hypothetical protein